MVKRRSFFSVLLIYGHLPQQKVKIPTTYGKAPTRSAGRCPLAGGAKATPGLYPAIISNRANLQEYASSMHRPNALVSSPEAAVIYFSPQAEVPFFYPYGISPFVQHGASIL